MAMKIKTKIILSLLLASLFTLGACSSSSIVSSSESSSETTSEASSESSVSSSASSSEDDGLTMLDFYNINDFHGAVAYDDYNGEPGINRLASYFNNKRSQNPDGMVLTSSGDMWQGSADSNLTEGRLVTDAMNLMGFDAMAIGNHEFDWGEDAIEANRDLADFPLLGANIYDVRTSELASFALPHALIERQGVQIGIIGVIGANLESVIMPSIVANFEFRDITSYVATSAAELETMGADVIILLNHDGYVGTQALAAVDMVFNGHTHTLQEQWLEGKPVLQAHSNGRSVAHVRLSYNHESDAVSIVDYEVDDYIVNQGLAENAEMAALYQTYYENEIQAIKDEVIGTATDAFSYANVGNLAVASMLAFGTTYGARVAIHNTGGIRATIPAGTVTFGDVYKALPFDNDLIVLELTGSQLKTWLSRAVYVAGVGKSTYVFADDATTIQNDTIYTIITISYLSENLATYPHDADSETNTYAFARDLVAETWRLSGSLNPSDYAN